MDKAIAFPTCVSVNHCVEHYCPTKEDQTALKDGDVVKIDLGVHIDGCIALVGHTTVASGDGAQVTGRKADVICAAHFAAEVFFSFFCFVLFCFVLFCFVLFCFVLFCFVLFCFVLFCFVLFCFVLFCVVFFFSHYFL